MVKRVLAERIRKSYPERVRVRLVSGLPPPLRRATFRQLWVGMSVSYAGDRLQGLAQAWLVATFTSSALAVSWITALGSLPLLLIPIGGVIADRVDRRRLLITWQVVGAVATAIVTALFLVDVIAVWHIYVWAVINGIIHLVSRPAYKVALTQAVPSHEVRPAVALNSMSETGTLVVVHAAGSMLLGLLGLPIAFVLNTATYVVAAASLWHLRTLGRQSPDGHQPLAIRRVLADLGDGVLYLTRQPLLLRPLLLTFATIVATSPAIGLLAAIVHAAEGSIIDLGLLTAATSVGAFVGAGFAGARSEGDDPTRCYALLGSIAAVALALFAFVPVRMTSVVSLTIIGFVTFSEAVWNTSRVHRIAEASYQARLQAITSMAFTLGFSAGMLWAGVAIDQLGRIALLGGAVALGILSLVAMLVVGCFGDSSGEG